MSGTQNTGNGDALGPAFAALVQAPIQVASALVGAVGRQQSAGGCEIPTPCWEPTVVATCCLELARGSTGLVRVHVSNCGWSRNTVFITALGKLAGSLSMQPTVLHLDPQDRGSFGVVVHPPKGLKPGQSLRGVILVRGCKDYAIKLEVKMLDCVGNTCCDVSIEDCPDHVHHWYEHFYCPRPCRSAGRHVPPTHSTRG